DGVETIFGQTGEGCALGSICLSHFLRRTGSHPRIKSEGRLRGGNALAETEAMDARTRVLLEAPIGPTIARLALPNVAIMVVQAAIGLIETYFVAKLGTDALAGMALVFPVLMLIQMVSAGAMGGGILSAVARALGSDRREEAGILAWHATAIAVV